MYADGAAGPIDDDVGGAPNPNPYPPTAAPVAIGAELNPPKPKSGANGGPCCHPIVEFTSGWLL